MNWVVANRLRILAVITVMSTGIISFGSIEHLASSHDGGFTWMSWLFPLCLDAVAAVGVDLWLTRSKAWRGASVLALSAIAMSLAANTADHWLTTHTVLAGILGAVPPAMLAALLIVLHRHSTPDEPQKPKMVTAAQVLPDFKIVHADIPTTNGAEIGGRHHQGGRTMEEIIRGPS